MVKRAQDDDRNLVYSIGRTIYFFDYVESSSVCSAIRILDKLQAQSNKPIQFIIDSGGGNCYDGLALYDKLRNTTCRIEMVGTGIVGSMAVPIFLAGDKRYITQSTRFMNHQGSAELEGRVEDIKIHYNEMVDLERYINDIITERTGQSTKYVINSVKLGDNFFDAEEALKLNFAHKIIKNRKHKKLK